MFFIISYKRTLLYSSNSLANISAPSILLFNNKFKTSLEYCGFSPKNLNLALKYSLI